MMTNPISTEYARILTTQKKAFIAILAIACLVGLAYANSLSNGFVWDDEHLILNNPQIKSISHLNDIFKTCIGYGSGISSNFYRPIHGLTNMFDYFIWGENAFGYHLTNVMLHIIAAMLVFVLVFYITKNLFIPFLSALLFGIHPINTEVVTYVAGRADILYLVFFLLSLIFYIKFCDSLAFQKYNINFYIASIISFALSMLSKEMAAVLPFIMLLYLYVIFKSGAQRKKIIFLNIALIGYIVALVAYVFIRCMILESFKPTQAISFSAIPIFYRLLTFIRTISIYLGLLIFPHDLHMERNVGITTSLLEPHFLFSFLIVIVMLYVAFRILKRNKAAAFFMFWFFIMLLPVSNVVPLNSFILEHWLYGAQIGFFVVISYCFHFIYKKYLITRALRIFGIIFLSCVILFYGLSTFERNKDWKDSITFYNATLRYNPDNVRMHLNLGNAYYKKHMKEDALAEYKKALAIYDKFAEAYLNMGMVYLSEDDFSKAEQYFKKAINTQYDLPMAHSYLSAIYYARRDLGKAKEESEIVLSMFPASYQSHNILAKIFIEEDNKELAQKHYRASLNIYANQPKIKAALDRLLIGQN